MFRKLYRIGNNIIKHVTYYEFHNTTNYFPKLIFINNIILCKYQSVKKVKFLFVFHILRAYTECKIIIVNAIRSRVTFLRYTRDLRVRVFMSQAYTGIRFSYFIIFFSLGYNRSTCTRGIMYII